MKVFAHPGSTCTRKVLTTLHETNTPFEFHLVDLAKGEHKAPAHLEKQPFGQVPAIIDDNGFVLFESRAICRYINEKAKGHLIPSDLRQRATMEQWMSVEGSNFTPHAMKFVYHHIFGRPQDDATLSNAETALTNTMKILDAHLGKNAYFAGNDFSLADICYMPYVEYLMPTPAKPLVAAHTNVMAWWNRCSERPSWRKVTGR